MKRIIQLSWLVGALSLGALSQGEALAAVTVGSNLTNAPNWPTCNTTGAPVSCTLAHLSLPGTSIAAGGVASPIDGVAVRWRIKLAGSPFLTAASGKLRILHGNLGAGSGPSENLLLSTGTYTFPTRLAVRTGDRIGLDASITCGGCGAMPNDGLRFAYHNTSPSAGTYDFWNPPLADGASAPPFFFPASNEELLHNADVEPDADHDGFGDETQDQCPTDASTHAQCQSALKDAVAPKISALALTNRTFKVDKRGSAAAVPRGTVIRYRLSEAATVAFSVKRARKGRRSKGKCRPRARKGKRCRTYKGAGSFKATGTAGRNEKIFSGKIGARRLKRGSYRMTLVATDAAGNRSKRSSLSFAVVR